MTIEPDYDAEARGDTLAAVEGQEFDVREAATAPPPPEPADHRAIVEPPATVHPLDAAPVNSKIVKTLDGAWLATPAGVTLLPKDDPAWFLPNGAKIQKRPDGLLVATQLSASLKKPDLIASSTLGAIKRFNPHFHEVRQ